MRDLLAHDPSSLAANVRIPMLIVQGDRDLQVSVADARLLARGQPRATLVIALGVNHVLKMVPSGDARANAATYADRSLLPERWWRRSATLLPDERPASSAVGHRLPRRSPS